MLKGWLLGFLGCVQTIFVKTSALRMNRLSPFKIFIFPFYPSFQWNWESGCLSGLSLNKTIKTVQWHLGRHYTCITQGRRRWSQVQLCPSQQLQQKAQPRKCWWVCAWMLLPTSYSLTSVLKTWWQRGYLKNRSTGCYKVWMPNTTAIQASLLSEQAV